MLNLKSMGVINLTPDSFSDASDPLDPAFLKEKLRHLSGVPIWDFGAESTAPMNEPISFAVELERYLPYLDEIFSLEKVISIDTYHPQTIAFFQEEWIKKGKRNPLVWNDVSGKVDDDVLRFVSQGTHFQYVYCHNLAPTRWQSSHHMDFVQESSLDDFLESLISYLKRGAREQFILDPCLGFSKSYEQNWHILNNVKTLQQKINHPKWLIGFSRKSFLRQKHQLSRELSDREELDQVHLAEIKKLSSQWQQEVWLRTHRPDLPL